MSGGQQGASVRRLAPTDRRSPRRVAAGACPFVQGCFCCPAQQPSIGRGKQSPTCQHQHPQVARDCSPPWPDKISACPERQTIEQYLPEPKEGWRNPSVACCIECGRMTQRRWIDPEGRDVPWCGGKLATPTQILITPRTAPNAQGATA